MNLTELQQKIDEADIAYYSTGSSLLDDAVYDSLKEELRKLDPRDIRLTRVGASVRESILEKRGHAVPMNSLDKVNTWTEFKDYCENNFGGLDVSLHGSFKADGGSYSFEYKDGRLVYAVSRGDGVEGEDITANALKFKGLPKYVSLARIPFTGFVRGEVILDNDAWEIADPDLLTNPRNTGVGIASRKDGTQSELLRVLAFRVFDINGTPLGFTEEDQLELLKKMGFETVPASIGNAKYIWSFYEQTLHGRADIGYWIDGIVVKVNNLQEQIALGETAHHPKGQVALKFPAIAVRSVLRGVTLQVGQTGTICPVANFDAIKLGGATVCNATLHNWDYIRLLDIAIGDTIDVIKAGDIIPKVIAAPIKGIPRISIPEPTECPTCKSPVLKKTNVSGNQTAAIFCSNDKCPSKISGKINKFINALGIMGAGGIVVETLIKENMISDAADLYTLKLYENSLPDIMFGGKVRFGEKRATNLLTEIDLKRDLELSVFLGALGIPGLGRRRVEIVQQAAPKEFDTLADWFSNKLIQKASQIGLPNTADNIQNEILSIKSLIDKFIKNGVKIAAPYTAPPITTKQGPITFNGKVVSEICITGTLTESRDYYERKIKQKGIGWATSVKSSTSHLIMADPSKETTKSKAAKAKGVYILSGSDLNTILGI